MTDQPGATRGEPARQRSEGKRVSTAIRFDPVLHEAMKETATELGVGVNWLVNALCREGLERMDLTGFSLVRKVDA